MKMAIFAVVLIAYAIGWYMLFTAYWIASLRIVDRWRPAGVGLAARYVLFAILVLTILLAVFFPSWLNDALGALPDTPNYRGGLIVVGALTVAAGTVASAFSRSGRAALRRLKR